MNYKLFLPLGAKEFGSEVTLENGLTFPRYAFVAVPIVGTKGNTEKDILSDVDSKPVFFDTRTNRFVLDKKQRDFDVSRTKAIETNSLSTSSNEDALIKFNFDGYINISNLITKIKTQIKDIKEQESSLIVFEQDVGYTTVRQNNQVNYEIVTIDPADDYENVDYQLSENLILSNLLVYQFRNSTLLPQNGVPKKLIVQNLKNLAVNIYEPIFSYFFNDIRNIEVFSSYVEKSFYASDEEFYVGEAIQFRFPGATSSAVYLLAKELISLLYYDKLYLDYYYDSEPKITIILSSSSQKNSEFGTRFENNIIHANRLVNIDKSFDDLDTTGSIMMSDRSINNRITLQPLNYDRDKLVLQNFIKDALDKGYIQSEEEAIKFAYATNINISNIIISPNEDKDYKDVSYNGVIKRNEDRSLSGDSKSVALNTAIRTLLPSLIKCPPVSNGSVSGYPDQSIFPMMSSPNFKPLTDTTMVYNPAKTAGQLNTPQHMRFNNPMLVGTVDGVTNKPEDGYIGEVAGKALYTNRLGGLVAGLRQMATTNPTGQTLQSVAQTNSPIGTQLDLVSRLTQAIFGIVDPTGAMLGCVQLDPSADPNTMIVMIATMLASLTGQKQSPMTYEEIKIAKDHAEANTENISRNPGGGKINETRDPTKEQPLATTKTDQDPASTPKDVVDTTINSTKTAIIDKKGVESETKSEKKVNQESVVVRYDPGTDHEDRDEYLSAGNILFNTEDKEEIMT